MKGNVLKRCRKWQRFEVYRHETEEPKAAGAGGSRDENAAVGCLRREATDAKTEMVWTCSGEHQQKVAEVGTGRQEVLRREGFTGGAREKA